MKKDLNRSVIAVESGSAAVEFAIIAPILALLFISLVELGFAIRTRALLGDAAAEGINAISLKGENVAAITSAMKTATGRADMDVSVSAAFCGCPDGATVVAATCVAICTDGFASRKFLTITATLTRPSVFPGSFAGLPAQLSTTAMGLVPP